VPELILHRYPESLFSEKARAILNARQLQVGADIYCDTALIAAYLDDKGAGPHSGGGAAAKPASESPPRKVRRPASRNSRSTATSGTLRRR